MKQVITVGLALVMFAGVAFAQSHLVQHYVIKTVSSTAEADFPYKAWDIYNMAGPGDYLNHTSVGHEFFAAPTLFYYGFDTGNFGHPWVNGDTVCVIGSYEADPGLFSHAGYYWLFSDMLDGTVDPDPWTPWDTLRIMDACTVSASRRTINVEITNPYETDRAPWGSEEYDVLGFWVIADTTASGLPGDYDVDLGFAPVNGGPGNVTTFTYDSDVMFYSGFAKSTYHSYYIVARPETTVTSGVIPGFSTTYMAQNSNLYIFGVEESDNAEYVISSLAAAPNPFTQNATISYSIAQSSTVRLTVYNAAGQLIQTLVNEAKPAGKYSIGFDGGSLPSGIYFYRLKTAKDDVTKTFVKVN